MHSSLLSHLKYFETFNFAHNRIFGIEIHIWYVCPRKNQLFAEQRVAPPYEAIMSGGECRRECPPPTRGGMGVLPHDNFQFLGGKWCILLYSGLFCILIYEVTSKLLLPPFFGEVSLPCPNQASEVIFSMKIKP